MRAGGNGPSANSIHAIRTGPRNGDPVVLVHPVGLDLTYWGLQIEALCDAHDVIAFDLPGHGLTPGEPADWTLDRAAATLREVIASAGAERAHVVGLSVGGMIAQALALSQPTFLRSLVLIDTSAGFTDEARAGMQARAVATREGGMPAVVSSTIERWFTSTTVSRRPDLIDRVRRTLLADDALIHAAMWDMISKLDLISQLHRIACPTLVLVGEHDPSSPVAAAQILHENISGSRMHVIPNASHMSPLEESAKINAHLLSFLSDQRGHAPMDDAKVQPLDT